MADLRGMPADLSRFYPPTPADESPFIGLDGGEPDRFLDFKRMLELTGEQWLNHAEAIDLLRKREPMSIGAAEAILDELREKYFAGEKAGVRWQWFRDDTDFFSTTNKPSINTVFGWTLHIGDDSNPRSVRNFPMQANGAEPDVEKHVAAPEPAEIALLDPSGLPPIGLRRRPRTKPRNHRVVSGAFVFREIGNRLANVL
jgi:hypothetical protein